MRIRVKRFLAGLVICCVGLFGCTYKPNNGNVSVEDVNQPTSSSTADTSTITISTTNGSVVSTDTPTTTSTDYLTTSTISSSTTTNSTTIETTVETTSETTTIQPTTSSEIASSTTTAETWISSQTETVSETIASTTQTWWTPPNPVTTPVSENLKPMPEYLQGVIDWYKTKDYPGIHIGAGIFSIDGKKGYVYNENEEISGGCTVKAPYTLFVLKQMPLTGYNVWTKYLTYQSWMKNTGSGSIQYDEPGSSYTVNTLLTKLDYDSDNTAYNILVSEFPLTDFQVFLNSIGGQNLYGLQYGKASVMQRRNEWVAIMDYINSGELYADQLYNYLHGTLYCYLVQGMSGWHDYLHKSGWSDGMGYTSASDVAVIDNKYILVIMTADYSTGTAHTDVVKGFGGYVEKYINSIGGPDNLFIDFN